MKRLLALALACAAGLAALPASAQDTLAKIKEKGVLTVGVKNDYKPWGFLDPSGKIVGLEIDLAQAVADKLGVKLEMMPVIAANRMEFLKQGRIDMILATMGDTPDRRKIVGMVEPNYYAGATNVLAPKSANLKKWEDLKGRKVCAVQGAYYNRRVTQMYAPELVVFPSVPDALNALQGNNCVAFLFDDTLIVSTLVRRRPEMGRTTRCRWSRRTRSSGRSASASRTWTRPSASSLKEMSVDWHKSGKLLELETKWGIKQSPYLIETNKKLKAAS